MERFLAYTNEFPWTWTPAIVEEFFSDLRSISRRKQSTVRGYQNALRLFCSYVSDPDYGWDRVCEQRFGAHPAQVFFEWNTAAHVQDNEQSPTSAPSRSELQDFFDHADDQVSLIAASGRKGWLPAYRDAVMFKIAYSYGLRFNELRHLQTVDFARNPACPGVRTLRRWCTCATARPRTDPRPNGAACSRYSTGRRRSSPIGLAHGQPYLDDGSICSPARKAPWSPGSPYCAGCGDTATNLAAAGLDLHSLRRSYATHLIEDGWDPMFVQHQMGHEHASTTSLYTCVSSDFRIRTLRRVLDATIKVALSFGEETS